MVVGVLVLVDEATEVSVGVLVVGGGLVEVFVAVSTGTCVWVVVAVGEISGIVGVLDGVTGVEVEVGIGEGVQVFEGISVRDGVAVRMGTFGTYNRCPTRMRLLVRQLANLSVSTDTPNN